MATNLFDSYTTDGSANQIILTVHVGNGQLGATSVMIGTTPVVFIPPAGADGLYRGNFTIPLGTNTFLVGKTLQLETDVAILMAPTESSVRLLLTGGVADRQYDLNNPAAGVAIGDEIDYTAVINFI